MYARRLVRAMFSMWLISRGQRRQPVISTARADKAVLCTCITTPDGASTGTVPVNDCCKTTGIIKRSALYHNHFPKLSLEQTHKADLQGIGSGVGIGLQESEGFFPGGEVVLGAVA